MKPKAIAPEVITALSGATLSADGLELSLPQVDRKIYTQIHKVLEVYGGKWNRKLGCHVFPESFAAKLAQLIEDGTISETKNPYDFFATPLPVIQLMLQHLHMAPHRDMNVLEPSAGDGAIARHLWDEYGAVPDLLEIDPRRRAALSGGFFPVVGDDFLAFEPTVPYDLIVMNPPFTSETDKLAYIAHVMYAHSCLAEGGELVAVVPEGFMYRQDARVAEFRDFVDKNGSIGEQVPAGAFKDSGTGIICRIIRLSA